MFKNLLKFSFSYSLIEGIQKGILFLLIPVFTHYMSTKEYGVVSTVLMMIPFLSILFALTLLASISRFYFKYRKNKEGLKDFLGTVFCFQFCFAIVMGLLTMLFGKRILMFFFDEIAFNPYILIGILISILQPLLYSYFAYLKAAQNLKAYIWIFNLYFVIQIGLMLVFIIWFKMRHDGYLIALLIANGVSVLLMMVSLSKKINFVIKKKYLVESLKYSIPIMPVDGISLVNTLVDRFYILKFIGLAMVGIYFVGVQIGSVIALIALAINSAYVPIFFKHYESKNDDYSKIYQLGDIIVYFMGFLTAVVTLLSTYFLKYFFSKDYQIAQNILVYLCFLSAVKSVYFLNTNVLSLETRLVKIKTLAITIGATINVCIGYFLTKYYSIIGASISTLIGFVITTLMLIYLVRKKTSFQFSNLKYFIYLSGLFIACFFLIKLELANDFLSILVKLAIIIATAILFLLFFERKTLVTKINGYFNFNRKI